MSVYRASGDRPRIRREDQLIFETPLVRVAVFEARPEDPHFHDSGTPGEHLLAFPLTSVRLEMESFRPFVADRNVVIYYNPDQAYRRSIVSRRGDRAHWIGLGPDVLEQILAELGYRPAAGGAQLFPFVFGPSDTHSYRLQLGLVRDLISSAPPAPLEVEERALAIVRRVVERACRARGWNRGSQEAVTRRWAESARELLAATYAKSLSVHDVARALGCSPYHLCRVFRRDTGFTLHGYRERLRLRRALLEIGDRRGDLTGLALDLGYSSHSHFTAAFRTMFGQTPSMWTTGSLV